MARITYIDQAGTRYSVEVPAGSTLMEGAIDHGVPGIVAECGGACACATCHAYIDQAWLPRVPAMEAMEDAMLDSAMDRRANSRLTCQLEVTDELDGLVLTVAPNEY
jgi:2Fe-2S ferredoxin